MVEYTAPPEDLSRLNPIQRYMQKGSLEWSDWMRLGVIVLIYWLVRPYAQKLFRRWGEEAITEGEKEKAAYEERRAAASVSANDIRTGKKETEGKTLGYVLAAGPEGLAASSGADSTVASATQGQDGEMKNRKAKKKGVSFAPEKSEVDKTLDWEDDSEFDPRRSPLSSSERADSSTGDIKQWVDKWTS